MLLLGEIPENLSHGSLWREHKNKYSTLPINCFKWTHFGGCFSRCHSVWASTYQGQLSQLRSMRARITWLLLVRAAPGSRVGGSVREWMAASPSPGSWVLYSSEFKEERHSETSCKTTHVGCGVTAPPTPVNNEPPVRSTYLWGVLRENTPKQALRSNSNCIWISSNTQTKGWESPLLHPNSSPLIFIAC